jgi:hypothetical protein
MERQLEFGIEIVGAETIREADGLAMSSRNGYLSAAERAKAPELNAVLRKIKDAIEAGSHRFDRHEAMARADLEMAGWKVDYVAVRNRALAPPAPHDTELVVLAAAALGNYPTPLVGYGGSAILGYLLCLIGLPQRRVSPEAGQTRKGDTVEPKAEGSLRIGLA